MTIAMSVLDSFGKRAVAFVFYRSITSNSSRQPYRSALQRQASDCSCTEAFFISEFVVVSVGLVKLCSSNLLLLPRASSHVLCRNYSDSAARPCPHSPVVQKPFWAAAGNLPLTRRTKDKVTRWDTKVAVQVFAESYDCIPSPPHTCEFVLSCG